MEEKRCRIVREPLRVAISGKSGCGNTTVSRLLAESLGVGLVNYTFRSLALEDGVAFEDIVAASKTDPRYDRRVDEGQVERAMEGSCVLGSRLAIWMLDAADLRVYLDAPPEVRARRIQLREGGDLDAILAATLARDAGDTERYRRLYGIDNSDITKADLVIDTADRCPPAIVALIHTALRQRGLIA
jgi:cytidylate kinase